MAVTFVPTGNGPATGTLTVNFSGTGSPASVGLTGLGKILSDLAVSPLTVDLGSAFVGYAGNTQQVSLNNVGASPLTISGYTLSDPQFSQTNNCPVSPGTLGPASSCTVNLTFTPTAVGPQSATLTIQHSGTGNPQTISLIGTGATPIYFAPPSLTFGSQLVGTSSSQMPIAVSNNIGTPITIQSIVIHGGFPRSYRIHAPLPGNSCQASGGAHCRLCSLRPPPVRGRETSSSGVR